MKSENETLVRAMGDKKALLLELDASKTEADLLSQRLSESEKKRRDLHNTIQEIKGNVRVMCRIRPFLNSETVNAEEGSPLTCSADQTSININGVGSKGEGNHSFTFDHVWDMTTFQENIFEEVSQLVQSALDGYNVCLFAYGQTGSGKT